MLKHFFRDHIILKDCIHPDLTSQAFFWRGSLKEHTSKYKKQLMTHLTTENAINSNTTAGTLTCLLDNGQED
jgi:hypothetical protein